jgi:hypothetical protein
LRCVQEAIPKLITPSEDVEANCSFSRTFRRTAKGKARGANLDIRVQNAMKQWRKIEEARGKHPRLNMVEHYSYARDLMPVT